MVHGADMATAVPVLSSWARTPRLLEDVGEGTATATDYVRLGHVSMLPAPVLVGACTRNHVAVRPLSPRSCLGAGSAVFPITKPAIGESEWPRARSEYISDGRPLHAVHTTPVLITRIAHNPRSPFVRVAFLAGATHR
jgi:hypothetical protein